MSETCKISEGKYRDNRNEGKKKRKENIARVFNKNDRKVKNYYFTTNHKCQIVMSCFLQAKK